MDTTSAYRTMSFIREPVAISRLLEAIAMNAIIFLLIVLRCWECRVLRRARQLLILILLVMGMGGIICHLLATLGAIQDQRPDLGLQDPDVMGVGCPTLMSGGAGQAGLEAAVATAVYIVL